jgi:methionyl-tRNA synthetase
MNHYYVTSSIPYVNAKPHVGHALELVQADALARYYRAKLGEHQVHALTGSDENSLKNVQAAEKAGEEVADFVAYHAEEFKKLGTDLNLSFDDFIRTREDRHMKGAQKLWDACKSEDIYKKSYRGLYCVGCESFYTEKDCPDGKCPTHKKELDVIEEENYFFALSNYQDEILQLIESDTLQIFPETRKNEMLSFVRQGLEDFSISRSQERAKHWGVPVPGDDSQVMYVWFDALSNYITALGYAEDGEKFKTFWSDQSKRVHVIGKDISRFHSIYWPAMLMSAGLPLPKEIFVHGFFTVDGEKMSKSIGNVIHPKTLTDEFGIDAVRYFMLREMPHASDGDLSIERLKLRYLELANQLGNLVGRVAAMSDKYFDGVLEKNQWNGEELTKQADALMQEYKFKAYLDLIFDVVSEANEVIDKKAPFKLVKEDEQAAKAVLSEVADRIHWVAQMLSPIMPEAAEEILRRYAGPKVLKGDPLFPRLED